MAKPKSKLHRTISMQPHLALHPKTGEILDLDEVLSNLSSDVRLATEIAEWNIDHQLRQEVDEAVKNGNVPSNLWVLGYELGITVPEELLEGWVSGKSRFKVLVQDRAIRETISWNERFKAKLGESTRYVSQGWKRTADWTEPSNLIPKISLSAADNQYSVMSYDLETGELALKMVVSGHWAILLFKMEEERLRGADKICKPDVVVGADGLPRFHFALEFAYNYTEFSDRYVVGLDVGLAQYFTYSVYDVIENKVVETGTGSQRVHSLWNKIQNANEQVSSLQRRGRPEEAKLHREANSRRKKELAILAGRELAEVSVRFNNAIVVVEDLSWVSNTMQNGRWNRGHLIKWLTDSVELNGGRVMTVSAAQTSQTCSQCGILGVRHRSKRQIHCLSCGFTADRDVNAATNIAKRLVLTGVFSKCVATRKKAKKTTKKLTKRTRGGSGVPLRHPGVYRKNKPTPKRPKEVRRRFIKTDGSARDNDDLNRVVSGVVKAKEVIRHSTREGNRKAVIENRSVKDFIFCRLYQ